MFTDPNAYRNSNTRSSITCTSRFACLDGKIVIQKIKGRGNRERERERGRKPCPNLCCQVFLVHAMTVLRIPTFADLVPMRYCHHSTVDWSRRQADDSVLSARDIYRQLTSCHRLVLVDVRWLTWFVPSVDDSSDVGLTVGDADDGGAVLVH